MVTHNTNEQPLAHRPQAGIALIGWTMLLNAGLNGILFISGLIMCNTAPSPATDPACQTGYGACLLGDPQAVNGFFLCAGAVALFLLVACIVAVVAVGCSLGRAAKRRHVRQLPV